MKIKGSVFLVTGAGSGLGAAVARQVVVDGGYVVCEDVVHELSPQLVDVF
jgi:NAD(P)-dependent dehydrogenase (short-subunit alcohol dehydrogenase family)